MISHPPNYRPSLIVNTTQRCNYRCIMCFYGRPEVVAELERDDKMMSLDLFRRAMTEAVPMCSTLCLAGSGEFLMDRMFDERIAVLRAALIHNPRVMFWQTTNASLLTPHKLAFLDGISPVGFTISLDTVHPDNYATIRRRGKLSNVLHNLRTLRGNMAAMSVRNVQIQINVVLMKRNALYLPDVIRFAREIRAGVFVDHPQGFGPPSLASESLFHYPVWSNGIMAQARKLAEQCAVSLSVPPPFAVTQREVEAYEIFSKSRSLLCYQLNKSGPIQISANGDVSVCCQTELVFGNLHEQSFQDIFHSEKYDTYRRAIAEGRPLPPCDRCRHLYRGAPFLYESSAYQMDIPPDTRDLNAEIDYDKEGFFDWIDEVSHEEATT